MATQYSTFLAELREHGFNEGQNIIVDYRRNDDPRGIFAVAAELMRLQVDLVVATELKSLCKKRSLVPAAVFRLCLWRSSMIRLRVAT